MSNTDDREPHDDQREEGEHSRDTGGDAPAAATIDEREAVAEDEDDLFEDDE